MKQSAKLPRTGLFFLLALLVLCAWIYTRGKLSERAAANEEFLNEKLHFEFTVEPNAITFSNIARRIEEFCSTQFISASVCGFAAVPTLNAEASHSNVLWVVQVAITNRAERRQGAQTPLRLSWPNKSGPDKSTVPTGGDGALSLARSQYGITLVSVSETIFQSVFGWEAHGIAEGHSFRVKIMSLLDYKAENPSALLYGSPVEDISIDGSPIYSLSRAKQGAVATADQSEALVRSISKWASAQVQVVPEHKTRGMYCLFLGEIRRLGRDELNVPTQHNIVVKEMLAGKYKLGRHFDENLYALIREEVGGDNTLYLIEGYVREQAPVSGIYWKGRDNRFDIIDVLRFRPAP